MNAAIEIENLVRRFGRTEAVGGLSLSVPEGSIFAFLGPNGAGKTTTIKTVMNILRPTAGSSRVLGVESRRLGPREFRQIGYVSENQDLPDWMTVESLLDYCRPFYATWDQALASRLMRQFDLPPERPIRALSRGMRMKVALASSLAYRPRLLVLDEPFAGLDPLVRDEFVQGVLEATTADEWTVFVASHDVDDVERLADWVAIIDKGRLRLAEPVASLLGRFRQVEVTFDGEAQIPSERPREWLAVETSGRVLRFVEGAFDERALRENVDRSCGSTLHIAATPMPLRFIFTVLARSFRFET